MSLHNYWRHCQKFAADFHGRQTMSSLSLVLVLFCSIPRNECHDASVQSQWSMWRTCMECGKYQVVHMYTHCTSGPVTAAGHCE